MTRIGGPLKFIPSSLSRTNPEFGPETIKTYGTMGQETLRKMSEALKTFDPKLTLLYHPSSREFTILNSQGMEREAVEKIFAKYVYSAWEPKAEDRTDAQGNRIVILVCLPTSSRVFEWLFPGFQLGDQPLSSSGNRRTEAVRDEVRKIMDGVD